MKIHDFFLVTVIILSGCVPARTRVPATSDGTLSGAASICGLAAHGFVEGQTARVVAIYKTDKSHYAYLSSQGCGEDGILNVRDMKPITDETVKDFYVSGDQRCAAKGTPYICIIRARIDADIKIVRSPDGEFAAELLKVYGFSFTES